MPSVIACPACAGQLRLPDAAIGQQVCCPTCSNVFVAAVSPPPAPQNDSSASRPLANGHDPEPAASPRGLVGAVELKLSLDDEASPRAPQAPLAVPAPPDRSRPSETDEDSRPCPGCNKRIPRDSRRCYFCDLPLFNNGDALPGPRTDERADRDSPSGYERPPERRDRVPSRGVLILVLGIISLLCLTFFASPIGIILGLIAWVMGRGDLHRMMAQEMDPDGGLTRGGWICGMIGTILNVLLLLSCLGGMSAMLLDERNRSAKTYNQPIQYKDAVPDDEDDAGPWGNRNRGVRKQAPPAPPPGFNNNGKGQQKF